MDTWAHCPTCTRWFFVAEHGADPALSSCPVCCGRPDEYQQREQIQVILAQPT